MTASRVAPATPPPIATATGGQPSWARKKSSCLTFPNSSDALATFYSLLGTIDEHHDEISAPTPWRVIHVRGIDLSEVAEDRIAEEIDVDGFNLMQETGGFAIVRAAQQADAADEPPARS